MGVKKGLTMSKKIVEIFLLLVISSFIGCNNDDCSCPSVVTAELNESISGTDFQEGLITTETTINVETEEKELLSTIVLEEDTQFEDKNGKAVIEPPILVMETKKEEVISTSTIKFIDGKGEELKPTKAFKVGIKAPLNAKPGDKVSLNISGTTSSKIQKIIILFVDSNGFIFFNIIINDHRSTTTVIIVTLLGNTSTN